MTTTLYPSWIEIPARDLARARTFYREVFHLTQTEEYEEADLRAVVLRPSDKAGLLPGVSLVQSPHHRPCRQGVQVNFHVGDHGALTVALARVAALGGRTVTPVISAADGVRYVTVMDSEGNSFALSSHQPWERTGKGGHRAGVASLLCLAYYANCASTCSSRSF